MGPIDKEIPILMIPIARLLNRRNSEIESGGDKMSSTKSYFEQHSHHHPYAKDPAFYQSIIGSIRRIGVKDRIKVLDLGCGNGSFIKGLIDIGMNGTFLGNIIC
jgi:hypothetical protein